MSHLAEAEDCEIVALDRPFSGFDFVEERFCGSAPIRKLFSISRCREGRSLLLEQVPATGCVLSENEDLALLDPLFRPLSLVRISFWTTISSKLDLNSLQNEDCLGYALLKCDWLSNVDGEDWHVYEAVFRTYPHQHNFATARASFPFRAGNCELSIEGCLYAQQNGVNKTCAQVAIRSLAVTYFGRNDLSYRHINEIAGQGDADFDPSRGLTNRQISETLSGLGIPHVSIDYAELEMTIDPSDPDADIRNDLPYQKFAYSGVESGCGTLLSFNLAGPGAEPNIGHLIPLFGHTFNEDSWAPNAEVAYFRIGEEIAYLPSRTWVSSFLAHDDNFGANLCIPKSFIGPNLVSCVFELLPVGWRYSGVEAEFAASDYFYSILPNAPVDPPLPWLSRLRDYVADQRLILRHVPISKTEYLKELSTCRDWEMNHEKDEIIAALSGKGDPEHLWMVEVSVPEVFPTNKRKLGEILLDAGRDLSPETDGTSFVLARLPGYFVFFDSLSEFGVPNFTFTPSALKSHTRVFGSIMPGRNGGGP